MEKNTKAVIRCAVCDIWVEHPIMFGSVAVCSSCGMGLLPPSDHPRVEWIMYDGDEDDA